MQFISTPLQCFENLHEYPFKENFISVTDKEGNTAKMHFVEEGSGPINILLLHGQPSWSYLYRNVIHALKGVAAKIIAPDLIGFGKSSKATKQENYTYSRHVEWLQNFLEKKELNNIVMFCQDWGGLLGLRIAAFQPERFSAIIAANTFLPTGAGNMPEEWLAFKKLCEKASRLPIRKIIQSGCTTQLTDGIKTAYAAPFPSEDYIQAARIFPRLIPLTKDHPEARINQEAWQSLRNYDKPFITAFSDKDPITHRIDLLLKRMVQGAKNRKHPTIHGGGHFLQEDRPKEVANVIRNVISEIIHS